jgi:OmcA/MtrC family decaheme c-type cytochrome
MKHSKFLFAAAAVALTLLSGCGGGNDGGGLATPAAAPLPSTGTALSQAIASAATNPANDTSANSSSAFKVLQDNGVAAVIVAGPPIVNFAVFSDGVVKQGLTLSNVSLAIAKLVPGPNGEIDRWESYVSRTETTTGSNAVGSGPGGTPVLASAIQASTDPKPASQANQLAFNADGYYTYTFSTDITDLTKTNGVFFEPNRTHRVAIQLSYTNAAGVTVKVNPYFDVTFDANGRSVAVTDPNQTRVMADVSSCNACHDKLALHGGGRVDTQFCVMCHNPGTTDANSGNVLTMQTMVHKIHSGRLLKEKLDDGEGGEHYIIWGYQTSKHDYAEVGFPQDLRNCTVCHSGANPNTPQGDNWKTRPTKESCLTCHANNPGSNWDTTHADYAIAIIGPAAKPKDLQDADCAYCHRVGAEVSPERVHFNQNEENAAKYKVNIESATFNAGARTVTVTYFLSDPTNNNARYNLITPDCTFPAPNVCAPPSGTNNTKFGNLRFYLAYQNLVGQPTAITEFTAYNNGGSSANAYLYRGTNDGTNKYMIDIPLPADSATAVAQGTARVVGVGQVKEQKLEVKTALDPRPPVTPTEFVSVVVQHTFADVVLSGALNPRRQVVANEKCNVCHGALGTTTGSNTKANAFHGGARNTVEVCVLCHDQNRFSSTVMTNGLALSENYGFKRMIHGIHGSSKRNYPFTHDNAVIGAFGKDGILGGAGGFTSGSSSAAPLGTPAIPFATTTAVPAGTPLGSDVTNYAAEVAYPAVGLNCDGCHVNGSWRVDRGPIASVVAKPLLGSATPLTVDTDPLKWLVITPKAATCTACHDSTNAMNHVVGSGGASFGNATQAQSLQTQEICADCHAPGLPRGVDIVHGQK